MSQDMVGEWLVVKHHTQYSGGEKFILCSDGLVGLYILGTEGQEEWERERE